MARVMLAVRSSPRLDGLGFDIFLVDIEAARFADDLGDNVQKLLAKTPEKIALRAPQGAVHLVMTHSHSLDEAVCLQLLMRGDFAYLGLIGSKSKRGAICQKTGRRRGVASDAGSIDLPNWHQ